MKLPYVQQEFSKKEFAIRSKCYYIVRHSIVSMLKRFILVAVRSSLLLFPLGIDKKDLAFMNQGDPAERLGMPCFQHPICPLPPVDPKVPFYAKAKICYNTCSRNGILAETKPPLLASRLPILVQFTREPN